MPPIFIPEGLNVTSEVYIKQLRYKVLPWLKKAYPQRNYVFQQDGALPHTANKSRDFLNRNFAAFWDKDLWPPNSPDLNPLDFAIWGVMDTKARATPHRNLSDLKASIVKAWNEMSADFIIKSCRSFRTRLEAVLEADGGHIE